jgi:hypothetical protein
MTNGRMLPGGKDNEEITVALDGLAREGARRTIAAAIRAETDECRTDRTPSIVHPVRELGWVQW